MSSAATRSRSASWLGQRAKKGHDFGMTREAAKLALFRQDLQDVRRMLANIPSYMIFDDHEVTDDWNMTRDTCKALYGHPLGLRVAQNALVAYSLCQHWGNVPEVFEGTGRRARPCSTCSTARAMRRATKRTRPRCARWSPFTTEAVLATRPSNAVFHDPDSLIYHFTVEGPGHQIDLHRLAHVALVPDRPVGGGVLLPTEQLAQRSSRRSCNAPTERTTGS